MTLGILRSISSRDLVATAAILWLTTFTGKLSAQVPREQPNPPVSIEEVVQILAPKVVDVELLGATTFPPEIDAIILKFRVGITENKEWFLQATKTANGPIPYDKRMGISEGEHRRMCDFLKSEIRVGPIGRGRIRFKRSKNEGQILIFNVEGVPQLDGIVVDVPNQELSTRWGKTHEFEHVHASKEQRATGPWNAFGWRLEEGSVDEGNYRIVQFSVGRHLDSGKSLISIRAIASGPDGELEKAEAFVRFE